MKEWKPELCKKQGLLLRMHIKDKPTQFVILEKNVQQTTLEKLSAINRKQWGSMLDRDNNSPF